MNANIQNYISAYTFIYFYIFRLNFKECFHEHNIIFLFLQYVSVSLKYEHMAKHIVLKAERMEYLRYLINQAVSCFT